jgi:hypothetical protein
MSSHDTDHAERVVRLLRLIRSIDGWHDRALLREWHQTLYEEAEEIQRRHVAHAIRTRSHPSRNGLVNQYATISGAPKRTEPR